MNEFGASAKYAAATEYISIRALAWIAPVPSFAENVPAKMTELVDELERRELLTGDQMFHDRENQILDFLGPTSTPVPARRIRATRADYDQLRAGDFLRARPSVLDAIIEAGS